MKTPIPSLREQLAQGLAACRRFTIGGTLHLVSPELADALKQKALNAGKTVTENGASQWIEENEFINPGETGSRVYRWKGDKVQVNRFLVTRHPDGTLTKAPRGIAWRSPQ